MTMTRTENGGAILETFNDDGTTNTTIELSNREFYKTKIIRGLIRLAIVILAAVVDILFLKSLGTLTIGVTLLMLGWWLITGW